MDRAILHSDLNSFYASVETMLSPSLRGKAVAVCGCTEERHGIILAKSDKAKQAGVKTGMVNWEARKLCKDLILVPPQYDQYLKYSKLTQSIYQRYTDLIEPFGMDECWLDVTASKHIGSPMDIAESIRQAVREELGLTVSIGVSYNKIFAKLGSDMKKPDAITEIQKEDYKKKVWPLKCDEMIYCGRATTAKLEKYRIHTIGDIAKTNPDFLRRLLGINGLSLWNYANGTDQSRVMHKDFVSPVKSIGHGITCISDLKNEEEVWKVILALSQDIGHRLRVHELSARGIQIDIRGNDLFGQQYQCKLPITTQLPSEIGASAFRLFKERYPWNTNVRAVTVRAIDLVAQSDATQLSLYVDTDRLLRREQLENTIENLRSRFGNQAITYAILMGNLKMPCDGRDKVRMPSAMYR